MQSYDCNAWDLCGATESEIVIENDAPFEMTSDSSIVRRRLKKIICKSCGFLREGSDFSYGGLEEHYRDDYVLNTGQHEHVFFRDGVPISRSVAIADEMVRRLEAGDLRSGVRTVYEVGAGQGDLITQLSKRFPHAMFSGCEVNESAAAIAATRGANAVPADMLVICGRYDLIVAITVLEHLPSPCAFLGHLAQHLSDEGSVVVGQPMQDVGSYDIFFVDHLHHFHTNHVEQIAASAGLVQTAVSKSPWFANDLSLHLLRLGEADVGPVRSVPGSVKKTIEYWKKVFRRSIYLEKEARFAIYGLGEIATLLYCYGGLSALRIVVGLDDFPERYQSNHFCIPVKRLEDLTDAENATVDSAILCLNPKYHHFVAEKCKMHGLEVVSLFETTAGLQEVAGACPSASG